MLKSIDMGCKGCNLEMVNTINNISILGKRVHNFINMIILDDDYYKPSEYIIDWVVSIFVDTTYITNTNDLSSLINEYITKDSRSVVYLWHKSLCKILLRKDGCIDDVIKIVIIMILEHEDKIQTFLKLIGVGIPNVEYYINKCDLYNIVSKQLIETMYYCGNCLEFKCCKNYQI